MSILFDARNEALPECHGVAVPWKQSFLSSDVGEHEEHFAPHKGSRDEAEILMLQLDNNERGGDLCCCKNKSFSNLSSISGTNFILNIIK